MPKGRHKLRPFATVVDVKAIVEPSLAWGVINFLPNAEGTVCTFTGNFLGVRILKRFSCETGVTLETISVKQGV